MRKGKTQIDVVECEDGTQILHIRRRAAVWSTVIVHNGTCESFPYLGPLLGREYLEARERVDT